MSISVSRGRSRRLRPRPGADGAGTLDRTLRIGGFRGGITNAGPRAVAQPSDRRDSTVGRTRKGAGRTWFREEGPDGWWFRPDREHVQYWTNHSLPVAVVLYDQESEKCFWQLINRDTRRRCRRRPSRRRTARPGPACFP
ncbi:DUF4365 domain-containing protein [Streptomyces sp. NPDC059533]|uniref:DUF4365 domain-containing protein n=1 Tax=Streptomyces sp. NPDC059533 TaxID=3346858 RepID=UPI003676B3FB